MSTALSTLAFNGLAIRRDGDWFHATDMWRAAGADPNKKPNDWRHHDRTQELIAEMLGNPIAIQDGNCEIRTNRGRPDIGGGTWLGRKLALEYAGYLSTSFRVFMLDVVLAAIEPRADDKVKIAPPPFDMKALAVAVAAELRPMLAELPAPAVLAYDEEAMGTAVASAATLAASESSRATLARYLVSADPKRPIGDLAAQWIKNHIRKLARWEALALEPDSEDRRKAKCKSLTSLAHSDLREDVKCGRKAFHKLPAVYVDLISGWLDEWRARLVRDHGHVMQASLFTAAE